MGKWVNCKVFDVEYLKHSELTEDDLHHLFDTASLNVSLVLHMFRIIGDKRQDWEIIKMARTQNDWCDKYFMTRKQYDDFKKEIIEAIKNIWQYKDTAARQKAEWWLLYHGLAIKNKF